MIEVIQARRGRTNVQLSKTQLKSVVIIAALQIDERMFTKESSEKGKEE